MFNRDKKPAGNHSLNNDKQKTPFIQPKLAFGSKGDRYEVEADKMADKVVGNSAESNSMQKKENEEEIQQKPLASEVTSLVQKVEASEEEQPIQKMEEEEAVQSKEEGEEPIQKQEEEEEAVQAKCDDCEKEEQVQKQEEEEEAVQSKSENTSLANNSTSFESKLRGGNGGQKMDAQTRGEMESGFGADFSRVNIHNDSEAAQMSQEIGAQAFTHGNNIYFNKGKYNPNTKEGKHLLAHELTHTIQQSGAIQKSVTEDYSENLEANRFRGDYLLEKAHDHAYLISKGSKGHSVKKLQLGLINLGFTLPIYGPDGDFGNETHNAIVSFQQSYDLRVDGIVGSETMGTMDDIYSGKGVKKQDSCEDTIPFSGTFSNLLPVPFFSTKDCPNITLTFEHKANIHGFESCVSFGVNIDFVVFKTIRTKDKFQKTTLKFKMKNAVKHKLNFTADCPGLSITIKNGKLRRH
ncbi:putative peptidoglycan binding domain-containing protein [Tenacibaculum sediminilitoris]|uniref:eCIS core domain-containing protein n=1 Tax=Tenacibaculum sediminilitoris TaxID=1820334 RepID=UPI0038945D86